MEPLPTVTPDWVLPYAPPFKNGSVSANISGIQSWVEFGVTGQLMVYYMPSQYLYGMDTISLTIYDHPSDGLTPFPASTSPFEFRFHIDEVNNPPFALNSTFVIDNITLQNGQPYLGRLRYYDVESPHSNLSVTLSPSLGFFNLSLYLGTHISLSNLTNCSTGDLAICAEAKAILEQEHSLFSSNTTSLTNIKSSVYNYRIVTTYGVVTLLPPNTASAPDASANAVMFLYQPKGGVYAERDEFTFQVWDGMNMSTVALITIIGQKSQSTLSYFIMSKNRNSIILYLLSIFHI